MIIYTADSIEWEDVDMEGAEKVKMRILIGEKEGSKNIIMRHFRVAPGGHTPHHQHDFEHVIKIEKGKGILLDLDGVQHEVEAGMSAFIPANEMHQFQNPSDEDFEFLCIIPAS